MYFLFLYAFFSFFFNAGVLDLLMRVIFVSLCNIHFSVSVTFYFDSESPSVVRIFCVVFV